MIDLATERVVKLSRIREHLPESRKGRRFHPSTPYRWVRRGVVAVDGERVYLASIQVGGTLYTSVEAIQEFCARLSAGVPTPARPTSARRGAAAARAAAECDRLGL
jgi:hypothetical protein